jgi:hypothetical protein
MNPIDEAAVTMKTLPKELLSKETKYRAERTPANPNSKFKIESA